MKKQAGKLAGMAAAVLSAALLATGCGGSQESGSAAQSDTTAAASTDAVSAAAETESEAAETEEASQEVVTLTFWDENAGESRTPYYEELIRRFNESQDHIVVEYEGIPSSSAKEKYDVAIATDTTPDIGHCNAAWGSNWVAQECLVNLDDYFAAWDGSKDINENYVRLNRELDPEGRLFMITDTVSSPLMWVRTDILKEKGVEIPTTWDEFFDAAQKLTDAANGLYGFAFRGDSSSCVELQHVLYAYSGIEDYFDDQGVCTINAPEHVEFMERYKALYNTCTAESDITNGYKEMVAAFDSGSAAMIFHNTGSASEHAAVLSPDQYQAVAFPISKTGTYSYTAGSQGGFCIFDTCEYPDEAWEFIQYMLSEDANSYWNQSIGQIPMNNKVLEEAWVDESQCTREALNILASDKCHLVSQPKYLPDYSTIMNTNNPPNFQAMLLDEMSVQEFLDQWANQMTEAYKEYQNQ